MSPSKQNGQEVDRGLRQKKPFRPWLRGEVVMMFPFSPGGASWPYLKIPRIHQLERQLKSSLDAVAGLDPQLHHSFLSYSWGSNNPRGLCLLLKSKLVSESFTFHSLTLDPLIFKVSHTGPWAPSQGLSYFPPLQEDSCDQRMSRPSPYMLFSSVLRWPPHQFSRKTHRPDSTPEKPLAA